MNLVSSFVSPLDGVGGAVCPARGVAGGEDVTENVREAREKVGVVGTEEVVAGKERDGVEEGEVAMAARRRKGHRTWRTRETSLPSAPPDSSREDMPLAVPKDRE